MEQFSSTCLFSKFKILKRTLAKEDGFNTNIWAFAPILVISFLVVFCAEVTKILGNSLFIFHLVWPILSCKWKTSYRKSRKLNDEKPKTKLSKYMMSGGMNDKWLWWTVSSCKSLPSKNNCSFIVNLYLWL